MAILGLVSFIDTVWIKHGNSMDKALNQVVLLYLYLL
jgi:hypothetical protein